MRYCRLPLVLFLSPVFLTSKTGAVVVSVSGQDSYFTRQSSPRTSQTLGRTPSDLKTAVSGVPTVRPKRTSSQQRSHPQTTPYLDAPEPSVISRSSDSTASESSTMASTQTTSARSPETHKLNKPSIIGISFAIPASLLIIFAVAFVIWRVRRKKFEDDSLGTFGDVHEKRGFMSPSNHTRTPTSARTPLFVQSPTRAPIHAPPLTPQTPTRKPMTPIARKSLNHPRPRTSNGMPDRGISRSSRHSAASRPHTSAQSPNGVSMEAIIEHDSDRPPPPPPKDKGHSPRRPITPRRHQSYAASSHSNIHQRQPQLDGPHYCVPNKAFSKQHRSIPFQPCPHEESALVDTFNTDSWISPQPDDGETPMDPPTRNSVIPDDSPTLPRSSNIFRYSISSTLTALRHSISLNRSNSITHSLSRSLSRHRADKIHPQDYSAFAPHSIEAPAPVFNSSAPVSPQSTHGSTYTVKNSPVSALSAGAQTAFPAFKTTMKPLYEEVDNPQARALLAAQATQRRERQHTNEHRHPQLQVAEPSLSARSTATLVEGNPQYEREKGTDELV